MHGQIGDIRDRSQYRGNLDFYYRTRATLIEARRQAGGGAIDYDFYRVCARAAAQPRPPGDFPVAAALRPSACRDRAARGRDFHAAGARGRLSGV